ncbi:unnamed protein product [Linum trigynum]|uniref:Uncharacterized protein n=1 Tax=Linum trigynum TaxID=586398 RepID=A0AAV2CDP1_9ROSI
MFGDADAQSAAPERTASRRLQQDEMWSRAPQVDAAKNVKLLGTNRSPRGFLVAKTPSICPNRSLRRAGNRGNGFVLGEQGGQSRTDDLVTDAIAMDARVIPQKG